MGSAGMCEVDCWFPRAWGQDVWVKLVRGYPEHGARGRDVWVKPFDEPPSARDQTVWVKLGGVDP